MNYIESGFRRLVAYTVSGVAVLAFVLFLRALFMTQSQPTTGDSPIPPPPTQSPFPTPTPLSYRDFYWPSRLTNDPSGNYRPAVSPDGRSIAFAGERNGNWDIYLLDRTAGTETRLTDDPLNDMAPSWSPDGARIAYQHNVPTDNGPVLVDRIVMNADGSGKTVVASGAVWNGKQPPAWSPSSDRILFTDSRDVVIVNATDGREVARFTPPEVVAYLDPVWIDDNQVAFTCDGQLAIGDVTSGAVAPIVCPAEAGVGDGGRQVFARLPMWSNAFSRIGYVSLGVGGFQLISLNPDFSDPFTLLPAPAGLIQHAAWSPDGRFIAYYDDDSIHVAIAWSKQYRDNAPLFTIPNVTTGLSDLVGVSWLPDSSGFVFVASTDGQSDLYLATLNEPAIQAYLDYYPQYAPTQVLPPFPSPTPPLPLTPTPLGDWPTPTPPPDFVIPAGTPPYWLLVRGQADVRQVATSGNDIWLVTPNNGAIHSADGGGMWSDVGPKNLPRGQTIDLSPSFTVDRAVVASGRNGVYYSTDGGATWWATGIPPYSPVGYAEFANDGTVFVTAGDGYDVWRFENGVLNWQAHQTVDGAAVALIVASPTYAGDGTLYAVNSSGLWRSQDRGASWVNVMRDFIVDLAIDPSHPSTLYVIATDNLLYQLNDYGESRIGPLMPARLTAVAVAPDGTVLGGSVDGRIYESTDRGITWFEISTFSGEWIRDLIATDVVIYAVTDTGLVGGYREGVPVPATPTPTP